MFNTFQVITSSEIATTGRGGRPQRSPRRISTANACVECRRRKIRCDGLQPCAQCEWFRIPDRCMYSKPTQRVVPPKRIVERLQSQVDQYQAIVAQLFPGKDLQEVVALSRDGMIDLAMNLSAAGTCRDHHHGRPLARLQSVSKSEGMNNGHDASEETPDQCLELEDLKRLHDIIQGTPDDIVQGLSLVDEASSSYVGVSSITTAIKVMFETVPRARSFIMPAQTVGSSVEGTCSRPHDLDPDPDELPPESIGIKLIDSYFAHVHILMPMLDEESFRYRYQHQSRRDPPWLCLLNMVFALGSLSRSTCDSEEHLVYYQRARKHMDTETFGSGNLLTLQAFALLSGCYLRFLNRSNEAYAIMGATLRMAIAQGLHRDSEAPPTVSVACQGDAETTTEARRRTWWTLYVLDTWASSTTGQPLLGRAVAGMTTRFPRLPEQLDDTQHTGLLPLRHNVAYCKLATKVQDAVAANITIPFEELQALDIELERWHEELPPILRDAIERHCPGVLLTPRAIMHWRYQNLKLLMCRPTLLATALRGSSWSTMSADQRLIVGRCRMFATQTIADIETSCQENLVAGGHAVWMMYQAVMVPLVSLYSNLARPSASDDEIESWEQDVEKAITFFDRMQPWSLAAGKCRDTVQQLYNAMKLVAQESVAPRPQADASAPLSTVCEPQTMVQHDSVHIAETISPNINSDAVMTDFWDDMMRELPNCFNPQYEWWTPQDWPS
ncbi:uncharacterized protein SEPMUDRAFT_38644 [Sphaerulina musiva SO2202]|uniref:Zn(2)-C6 fungal-type domain-containing protein n=1 Tax=Sphaerulina musiva (strain SO2202) TaxID=692275 RepID=M3CMP8_SPHMS|nr:uncharacterized protein SEPMUDRAFT_38644 [Sphaerulina musiva SO2202]EMF15088.1 hypothetical protein SEPMUDRAFT_38644 [Sphaerulina musiva SO2202]